jgi:hypothetical protein
MKKLLFVSLVSILYIGMTNTYGQIAVNEIQFSHYSPRYSTASDEYVVLFNNSGHPIDLNGYEIAYASAGGVVSTKKQWTTSTIIPARHYFLCSSNASITVGSVSNKLPDAVFAMGFADAGQVAFRKTTGGTVIYAIATGVITSYQFGSSTTHTATTSSSLQGAFQLSASLVIDSTYIRTGDNNTDYTLITAASITEVPNSGDAPLPVELISFTSSVNHREATLFWTTGSELNNARFEVERKITENWKTVGTVKGSGTTTQPVNYSFTEHNLNTGSYQYRLKQIDFNGNYEYYPLSQDVVIAKPKTIDLLQNYPNPGNPQTIIPFSLSDPSSVKLIV